MWNDSIMAVVDVGCFCIGCTISTYLKMHNFKDGVKIIYFLERSFWFGS